jgi:hypothetical protein
MPVLVWTLASVSFTSALAQEVVQSNPATTVAVVTVNTKSNPPAASPRLSPWANEIVKLAKAGIEEGVILSFVENSGTFNLGADQIIQLREAGVSSEVITAMLQHDTDLASGARILTTTTSPPLDPELERILLAVRNASAETRQPPMVAAQPEAEVDQERAQIAWTVFQPETSSLGMKSEGDASPVKAKDASELFEAKVTAANGSVPRAGSYRVPETRSVQLLPPIVVVNSASPPPNVIIIDMFPSSR